MSVEFELVTTTMTAVAVGAAVSGLAAKLVQLVTELKSTQAKSNLLKSKTELGISIAGVHLRHQIIGENASGPLTEKLISQVEDGLLERLSNLEGLSKSEVREEIDKKVSDIRGRIEQIESRFPDTSTIDKISSINDALFAERIELLSKRLDSIESKMLGKWDVAIIVSTVIVGISFVVGATYSIITALGN
jgi:VIT1/CCC1 family predicted Fe2+/Mn2+ transporter